MRIVFAAAVFAVLGACSYDPPPPPKPPSTMNADEIKVFRSMPLPSLCRRMKNSTVRKADNPFYAEVMRRRGLNARDVEIILDRKADFGTGMTFAGLECSAAMRLRANKSFYQGLGHRWQVPFGGSFIYLEGNGTPEGMRVTSWN